MLCSLHPFPFFFLPVIFLAYFWLSLSSLKDIQSRCTAHFESSVRLLIPPSYSYPNYPHHQSLSYCLNISVQSFSYFIVPLFSANTSGALSYKVVRSCDITAANYQHPDPHKLIFSSLLMKMQLTGENISRKSLKYFFLLFY